MKIMQKTTYKLDSFVRHTQHRRIHVGQLDFININIQTNSTLMNP